MRRGGGGSFLKLDEVSHTDGCFHIFLILPLATGALRNVLLLAVTICACLLFTIKCQSKDNSEVQWYTGARSSPSCHPRRGGPATRDLCGVLVAAVKKASRLP